jgi:RNA cap guanine-N2 methyltransferase
MFVSPPWGGPSYSDKTSFDIEAMQPYSTYCPRNEQSDEFTNFAARKTIHREYCIVYAEDFGRGPAYFPGGKRDSLSLHLKPMQSRMCFFRQCFGENFYRYP